MFSPLLFLNELRPLRFKEFRKIQICLCKFISIKNYLPRFHFPGDEIFHATIQPHFCNNIFIEGG